MKKTIYLHIGHPKTGSTALQYFLASHAKTLASLGYLYPVLSTNASNHTVLPLYYQHVHCNKPILTAENDQTLKNKLAITVKVLLHWIDQCQYDKIILSSENLIYNADLFIDNFLKNYNVVIIAYFRRMDDYVESLYSEQISIGSIVESMQTHLDKKLSLYMNRYSMINELEKRLGKQNIFLRPFEKNQFKDKNLIADFLSIIGLNELNKFKLESSHINPTLPASWIYFLYQLGQEFVAQGHSALVGKVMPKFKQFAQNLDQPRIGCLLTYEQRLMLLEKTKDLDELIAKKYLERDDGAFFYNRAVNSETSSFAQPPLFSSEVMKAISQFFINTPTSFSYPKNAYINDCYEGIINMLDQINS